MKVGINPREWDVFDRKFVEQFINVLYGVGGMFKTASLHVYQKKFKGFNNTGLGPLFTTSIWLNHQKIGDLTIVTQLTHDH